MVPDRHYGKEMNEFAGIQHEVAGIQNEFAGIQYEGAGFQYFRCGAHERFLAAKITPFVLTYSTISQQPRRVQT